MKQVLFEAHPQKHEKTEKSKKCRRKNEKLNNMCFLKCDSLFTKNEGLNRWAITGVLLKTSVKNVIKKGTTETQEKHEIIPQKSKKLPQQSTLTVVYTKQQVEFLGPLTVVCCTVY
jgi:hypothetical protein